MASLLKLGTGLQVIKYHAGSDKIYTWSGVLKHESPGMRLIEARFNGAPLNEGKLKITPGDRFVERYYSDRWYNLWGMYDGDSDALNQWYINLSRPAVFSDARIEWEDLALDLVIFPDGERRLLDQDEFALLDLDEETRKKCWQTLNDLLSTDLTRLLRATLNIPVF